MFKWFLIILNHKGFFCGLSALLKHIVLFQRTLKCLLSKRCTVCSANGTKLIFPCFFLRPSPILEWHDLLHNT